MASLASLRPRTVVRKVSPSAWRPRSCLGHTSYSFPAPENSETIGAQPVEVKGCVGMQLSLSTLPIFVTLRFGMGCVLWQILSEDTVAQEDGLDGRRPYVFAVIRVRGSPRAAREQADPGGTAARLSPYVSGLWPSSAPTVLPHSAADWRHRRAHNGFRQRPDPFRIRWKLRASGGRIPAQLKVTLRTDGSSHPWRF